MKSQTEINEVLGKAFNQKQQEAVFKAVTRAIELGTEDMASLKDLQNAEAKSDARTEKLTNRLMFTMISCTGLIIAAFAYFTRH